MSVPHFFPHVPRGFGSGLGGQGCEAEWSDGRKLMLGGKEQGWVDPDSHPSPESPFFSL